MNISNKYQQRYLWKSTKLPEKCNDSNINRTLYYRNQKQRGVIQGMNDEEIIKLYCSRSDTAISETDKKYRKPCMSIANNILNDISDSEECVNDAYLKTWNTIPPQIPKYFPAFLFRIVKNAALSRYSYNHRGKRNAEVIVSFEELGECIADSSDVHESVDKRELAELINEFLEGLSREKRIVFVRRYWYFDSVPQIAKLTDISEEKAKSMLMRLRISLRDFLKERGVF